MADDLPSSGGAAPGLAVMPPDPANAEPPGAETIETLFAALESPLLAYALRLTGERGAAEDLVQDAFMKLRVQFAEVREPRRWLYRAIHNAALNHRRQSGKLVPLDPPDPPASVPRSEFGCRRPQSAARRTDSAGNISACCASVWRRSKPAAAKSCGLNSTTA